MANGDNNLNPDPSEFARSREEVTKLRDQYNKFAQEEAKNNATSLDNARILNAELRDVLGVKQSLNDQDKTLRNLGNEIVKAAQQNVVELGNAGTINREISKAQSLQSKLITEMTSIAGTLSEHQQDIALKIAEAYNTQQGLSAELVTATATQAEQVKIVRELEDRTKTIGTLSEEESDRLKEQLNVQKNILDEATTRVAKAAELERFGDNEIKNLQEKAGLEGKINSSNANKLAATIAMSRATDDNLVSLREEERVQRAIEDRMGVTGALVEGTGALMERLGMRSGIFQQAMKDASSAMKDMAEESERIDPITNEIVKDFSKMDIMLKGLGTLASGFGKALFDPLSIGLKIISVLSEINKQSVEFSRLTGQAAYKMSGVATETSTAVDLMKVAAEYTKQTGINAAAIFTPQQLGQIADAKDLLGLSAEQAGSLGTMMKLTGQSADQFNGSVFDGVKALNESADAAIAPAVALQDVLGASDDIKASLGGNPEALGRAAAAARKLGMDLGQVNKIADGLLDFESSIESELEAQLLTGKNINLNKARELALNNDLEGVAKELSKQGASAAEFAKMNRIQQTAMAKAMGMSREELAKMVLTEKAMADMTEEQKAAARGVTLEQSKQMDIQERMKKAAFKLAEAFAPILEAVIPIVELLGKVAGLIAPLTPYLLGAYGAIRLMNGGITNIASGFGSVVKSSFDFVKNLSAKNFNFSAIGKAFKTGFGDKTKVVFDETSKRFRDMGTGKFVSADKAKALGAKMPGKEISTASTATSKVKPGKNIRVFLKNLAAGLKEMASMKVLYGALNLIPASIGLVAMIPGVIGAKLMEKMSGPKLLLSMQSLAQGLASMGTGKVLLGTLGLIASALAFTLMIPASAGMALMGLTAPMAAAGIFTLIPALTALGTAMASGVGALGLIALVGLAVGMGAAFALIGAGAMMMGKGIQYAAAGLTSILGSLISLAANLPQLMLVGYALMGIAAGLSMLAVAGIFAIPTLAALSTFALVMTPLVALGGLFGDGGGEEDNSMAEISSKLDTLISVVSAGGNVYLDGDKVGEAQVLGSYKLS
tara:strand:+ start:36 stop:3224 length:3189 start_codon:yes stop_codon:yes gene_type:complete